MNWKGFAATAVILVLLLAIAAALTFWYFAKNRNGAVGIYDNIPSSYSTSTAQLQNINNSNQTSTQSISLPIPAMYSGDSWQLVSSSYPALGIYPSLNFSGTVTGQLYEATNTNPNANAWERTANHCKADCGFYEGDESFVDYYNQALNAAGYGTQSLDIDKNFDITTSSNPTYILYPLSADGPLGSIEGYIKYNSNDNVRVIIISSMVLQNQIFISDIINLKTFFASTSNSALN